VEKDTVTDSSAICDSVAVKVIVLAELSEILELLADRETRVVTAGSMLAEPPHPDSTIKVHNVNKVFMATLLSSEVGCNSKHRIFPYKRYISNPFCLAYHL
jgi:SpoU rRNA methylase family enzyme